MSWKCKREPCLTLSAKLVELEELWHQVFKARQTEELTVIFCGRCKYETLEVFSLRRGCSPSDAGCKGASTAISLRNDIVKSLTFELTSCRFWTFWRCDITSLVLKCVCCWCRYDTVTSGASDRVRQTGERPKRIPLLMQIWYCDIGSVVLKARKQQLRSTLRCRCWWCCDSRWRKSESSSNFCCCWCCLLSRCGSRTSTSTRANPSNSTLTMGKVRLLCFLYSRRDAEKHRSVMASLWLSLMHVTLAQRWEIELKFGMRAR